LSPFEKLVEEALNQLHDPAKLGATSPLAAPYMLANYLVNEHASSEERGKTLRGLIRSVIHEFEGKHADRFRTIIQARYLEDLSQEEVLAQINVEKVAYHRSRKQAVQAVANALHQRLNPALQTEKPRTITAHLFGRDDAIRRCQQALAAGHSVTLTGAGGVGKTTLGRHLAGQWKTDLCFWYTFRAGVNDHINPLARMLGIFLRNLKQPLLWQEVLVNGDQLDVQRLIELVRYIIADLRRQAVVPLFCFDEIDVLQPDQQVAHGALIALLENLAQTSQVLLMGQQIVVMPQMFCLLGDLTIAEMDALLETHDVRLQAEELRRVFAYTHGNPRLLELFLALAASGESLSQLLETMTSAPPTEFLLHKLLARLTPVELTLLHTIAVFRNPVPTDPWSKNEAVQALQQLLARKLLYSPRAGAVAILPVYATLIYQRLPKDEQMQHHLTAATIRAMRGEETAAAHHWIRAGQPETAIAHWYQAQTQAINQGQASIALRMFRAVDPTAFATEAQQLHALICAELARLTGDLYGAQDHIRAATWSIAPLANEAHLIQGIITNEQSNFTDARAHFERVLQNSEAMADVRTALAHKGISWIHYHHQLDFDAAWQAAQMARYEAENIQGLIQHERGNFTDALELYQSALRLAKEMEYVEGSAKTLNNMCTMSAILGDYDAAKEYALQADRYYEQVGKLPGRYYAHVNLAFAANLASNYEDALAALTAIPDLAAISHASITARVQTQIDYQKAEAYVGLGELERAETHIAKAKAQADSYLMADCFRVQGEILLQRGECALAEDMLHESITFYDQYGEENRFDLGYAWRSLAKVYLAQGEQERAEQAIEQSIAYFADLHLPHQVTITENLLAS